MEEQVLEYEPLVASFASRLSKAHPKDTVHDLFLFKKAFEVLEQTRPEVAAIVVHHAFQDMTLREVAKERKITVSKARALLAQGLQFLSEEMKNRATALSSRLKTRQFGFAKGKIHISDDFDEPLEDFKGYM